MSFSRGSWILTPAKEKKKAFSLKAFFVYFVRLFCLLFSLSFLTHWNLAVCYSVLSQPQAAGPEHLDYTRDYLLTSLNFGNGANAKKRILEISWWFLKYRVLGKIGLKSKYQPFI